MKSAVIKRSISIDGHKTSITLEDEFWSGLNEIAQAQGASIAQTVKEIDRARRPGLNLSSAIRVFVLDRFRSKKVGATMGKPYPRIKRRRLGGTGADDRSSSLPT
jgi:predicted DNA-binding ribbon-helix-helix protein